MTNIGQQSRSISLTTSDGPLKQDSHGLVMQIDNKSSGSIVNFLELQQGLMKKPSGNLDQAGTSTNNMKLAGSQTPTQGKQFRDFEYSIYEHTNFQPYKNEYFLIAQRIRAQRLIEYLGRYKAKEQKQSQLNAFKINFHRLKELLILMTREADKYRSLMITSGTNKQVKSTNVSCDYEVSFRKKIRKDLKDIETMWIQLFVQGSLKRLISVLNMLRIDEDEINFGLDITQWHIETQSSFSIRQHSKGCCCV